MKSVTAGNTIPRQVVPVGRLGDAHVHGFTAMSQSRRRQSPCLCLLALW